MSSPLKGIRVLELGQFIDRKSTRLNSSHLGISYAVFCLKKKKDLKQPLRGSRRLYPNLEPMVSAKRADSVRSPHQEDRYRLVQALRDHARYLNAVWAHC